MWVCQLWVLFLSSFCDLVASLWVLAGGVLGKNQRLLYTDFWIIFEQLLLIFPETLG